MSYFLTEEQEMLKELCAQIAQEKILPVRAEYDETGEFPWDIVKVMAASDIYGVYIPEEYGGFGGGVMEMCIAAEELSRVCGGIALLFALGSNTPLFPLLFQYVPGFSLFQAPARWLAVTTVSLAALAALGAEQWPRGRAERRRGALAITLGLALLAGGLTAPSVSASMPETFGPATARLGLVLAVVGQGNPAYVSGVAMRSYSRAPVMRTGANWFRSHLAQLCPDGLADSVDLRQVGALVFSKVTSLLQNCKLHEFLVPGSAPPVTRRHGFQLIDRGHARGPVACQDISG